jgi:membrane-associated phospholipid phosphatase
MAFPRTEGSVTGRWTAVGAGVGFLALTLAVHLGLLDGWDSRSRQLFRPDDVWGTWQLRADLIVEGLRPERMLPLLAVFVVAVSLFRRSPWPAVIAAAALVLLAVPAFVAKVALARPDPHQSEAAGGASFPSGHTATIVVCLGLMVWLLRPGGRWWIWLVPAFGGALMGLCLLVQAAHWTTDVLGGALLAVAVLGVVCAVGYPLAAQSRSGTEVSVPAGGS